MADTYVLEAYAERREGSSPSIRTICDYVGMADKPE